jgi:phosphate transport system protein
MEAASHSRSYFDRQLQRVREDILLLGSMAEKSIERSVDALKRRDAELAQAVIEDDRIIDDRTYEVEEQILLLIATQQPMASDLRGLAAALFIIAELERMGDYAEGIAKIALSSVDHPPLKPLVDIPRMAEISTSMLHRSLEAFIDQDLEKCRAIWHEDDDVDNLYQQVYRELLTFMLEDPGTIERATQLLWAAHNLERIADRVTNVCERTAFVITGDPRALPGRVDPD